MHKFVTSASLLYRRGTSGAGYPLLLQLLMMTSHSATQRQALSALSAIRPQYFHLPMRFLTQMLLKMPIA
jgi:hypothetical protein